MYSSIVRRLVRARFAEMSAGDASRVVAMFGPTSTFCFVGDHALGGELTGRDEVAAWFVRLFATFPGISIEPVSIAVAGWPWATTVTTRFRVRAELPDGTAYRNEGVQLMTLRFGKVVDDRLYEDTAVLQDALARLPSARSAAPS
jgi:ketosteroid isomerase-like protein